MFLYILEKVTKNESKNKVDTFFFLLHLLVLRQVRGRSESEFETKEKEERQIYFLKYNRKSSIVFVRTTVQLSVTEVKRAIHFTGLTVWETLFKKKKKRRKTKGWIAIRPTGFGLISMKPLVLFFRQEQYFKDNNFNNSWVYKFMLVLI